MSSNKKKLTYYSIGLAYLLLLFICFFITIEPTFRLRSPFLGDLPSNNYLPFNSILNYLNNFSNYNFDIWFVKLLGNILIFIPLGIIAPIIFEKFNTIKWILFLVIIIRSSIEFFQYKLLIGVFDIDDIILSLIGGIIGFCLYLRFFK
uniref:VanZ family protein n=1 Tax=Ornithinibacillus sp. FSL M8-0202 TaxID=2921616 RepID=UPI00403F8B66